MSIKKPRTIGLVLGGLGLAVILVLVLVLAGLYRQVNALQAKVASADPTSAPTSTSGQLQTQPEQSIDRGRNGKSHPLSPSLPPSILDDDLFQHLMDPSAGDPFEEMERIRQHMDQLMQQSFGQMNVFPSFDDDFRVRRSMPQIDLSEDSRQYTVRVHVQEKDKNNIVVKLDGQQLIISGKSNTGNQDDQGTNPAQEFWENGTFSKTLTLPHPIKADEMTMDYKDSELVITIPKA